MGGQKKSTSRSGAMAIVLSEALGKASSLKPEIRLAQAVSEFEAGLTREQKSRFRTLKSQSVTTVPTPSDVMRLTAEFDRCMSKKYGGQCFGPRFTNFLEGAQQFAALGDVVIGGSQNLIACGVWSLVRMTLLSIVSVSNYVDKLSSIFMDIGRSTPRHQAISVLYPHSTQLQSHLYEYYIVVVGLCRCLFKFGQKSTFQQFTSSLNDGDLEAFRTDLDKWATLIAMEVQLNEAQEGSDFRALTRSTFQSASCQQKLATKKRVLDFCSTYDHVTAWKQLRKVGNTSLHTSFREYRKWRDSSYSCTLVYTAKLGSGKSVLLANIIDDLNLSTEQERPLVTYFFCKHDVPESLQARVILGSLARQLLRSVVDLDILLDSCGDTHTTDDADKILEMILQGYPSHHKAYFVVDGLDECDDQERKVLMQAIEKIQMKLKVLVCASIRAGPNNVLQSITDYLMSTHVIQLPEKNPDIDAFIKADLHRCLKQRLLTLGDPGLIIDIEDALVAGSQGMFLWAALQIQSLCGMKTDHAIRKALADLPKDLSQTFARILDKSGSSDRSLQAQTLQVVLAAERPLTTQELREALSVTPGDADWDPSKMLNDVYSALACCGCLLNVDEEESTVRVVHHSVKQYILHGLDDEQHTGFSIGDAQRTLADIIVTYLGYGVFETQISRVNVRPIVSQSAPYNILQSTLGTSHTASRLAMKLLASRKQPKFDMSKTIADACGSSHFPAVEDFKFYNYASIHWQKHIFYVSGDHGSVCKLAAKAIQSRTPTFKASHTSLTECRWAAEHGNIKVVELLFQAARTARTPLLSAIAFEREDVVEALLNAGVDVNERDGNNTPLKEAMRHYKRGSRIEITGLLLRTGKVDIKAADDEEEPLITIAAKRGDREIVELLLKSKNTNVNVQDYTGRTALIGAALNSNIDLVKLLLDVGKADPNLQDSYGETALTWAAFHGSRNLVELLLASGSDPNLKNRKGQTALMQATAFRKDQVFELLTNNKNVGRNAKDTIGQTAQVLAKPEKHTEIMELREPRPSPSTNKGTMDRWKGVNVGTLQPLDRSFGYAQW